MRRARIVLVACAGLLFIAGAIQSSRAARFRSDALALRPAGASIEAIVAETAEVRASIARASLQSADALARPESLAKLADALVREVRLVGASLTRLALEPTGPVLTLSATGDRLTIAHLALRIDAHLEAHDALADRFSIAGGHDDGARFDLSVVAGSGLQDASVGIPAWPAVSAAAVAGAIEPRRVPEIPTPEAPVPQESNTEFERPVPTSTAVRWIGTVSTDGAERYILRFEEDRVVAVLGEGEAAVFGWSVSGRKEDRLFVDKEGVSHEVSR